jgi:Tol biopolymer transport system component
MALTRIAHYDVGERIGAGGMGEVYRAHDTKLGRDVALKVLPPVFADDAERLSRFEREARLLASLSHANIASIHGVEHEGSSHVLVMEMVAGEDLSRRIARGPVSVDEALPVARQIAEALEAAHEQGVIHRDLKPANVMVDPDGRVKVLDFGLAKALDPGSDGSDPRLSQSPTIVTGGTVQGVILGTAAYMSPEQARGKRVDRRADIFAFGCVLYEMLTGKPTFIGETVSDTLAAVLRAEPDWEALPAGTPARVKRLLERCLDKDPMQRLRDIGEARVTIERVLSGAPDVSDAAPAAVAPAARRPRLPWALAVLFALTTLAAAAAFLRGRGGDENVVAATVLPPADAYFDLRGFHPGPVAVSPNGRRLAFTARTPQGTMLFVRELDDPEPRMLRSTEGAGYPFWSPDGRSVGFFVDGMLKRIDADGGPPLGLCPAQTGKGGSWSPLGVIVFARSFNSEIYRVPAEGGEAAPVTKLDYDAQQNSHRFPVFLPDGEHFIYVARAAASGSGQAGTPSNTIRVASIHGGEERVLMPTISNTTYANGHLLFLRETTLMARPFDADALEFTGEAVPLAEQVRFIPGASRGVFDAAGDVLVYQSGSSVSGNALVWRDLAGAEIGRLGDIAEHDVCRVAPDGSKVAVEIYDAIGGTADIWIYELARGIRTRFTFDSASETNPVWSPDGARIAFASGREGRSDIYVKPVSGASPEEMLLQSEGNKFPWSWSGNGYLAYMQTTEQGAMDVWAVPLEGERKPIPLRQSEFRELHPTFSPDGHWLAYVSDETGQLEVFVVPFPEPTRKWQISTGGGVLPRWSTDAQRMFYFGLDGAIYQVDISTRAGDFSIGAAAKLFDAELAEEYDVAPGAERMIFVAAAVENQQAPLTLVLDWTREAARRQR